MSSRSDVPPHPALPALNRALRRGTMDRRDFLTRACGLGLSAPLALSMAGLPAPARAQDAADIVPGGTLRVRLLPGREVELAGPAVLVADGTTTLV